MAACPENQTFYELLHVSRGAPVEVIRASYRTLMQRLRHHPDLGGDPRLAAMINEAYAVLTDPARRQAYDLQLDAAVSGPDRRQPEPAPQEPDRDPLLGCWFCRTPHGLGIRVGEDDSCGVCASPLYAAEKQRFEEACPRAVERIRRQQSIRFFTHWPQLRAYRGRTEDISLNGLRFSTRRELTAGQIIKISGESMDAVARVLHTSSQPSGWRRRIIAGASFLTLRLASPVGGFVSRKV
ncbi:MAG: DnaJ domain-containing protein [Woeseiaceae bacterium]|nr:DnaJ domain-containing protein [Woeseiaceae bacterium]